MMRFNFKPPAGVRRHKDYKGSTLKEANDEIRELRAWITALTEQLEYVIGKDLENGKSDN